MANHKNHENSVFYPCRRGSPQTPYI